MQAGRDKMKPILTIFTPTYNRAYTLHLGYESLKKQTCQSFVWLIIDDGSNDGTRSLVQGWIEEGIISIRYHYQENLGMHGAHNTAYELIETELNVCIDSDDYMPVDAVQKIITYWNQFGSEEVAGIVGLDAYQNGDIIGTELPADLSTCTLGGLYGVHKVKGDKKLVYRTALTKTTPAYPIFSGEKYCPLSYKYIFIDQLKPLLLLNEVLCHVEYLPDGSSLNMLNQYYKNPKGFAFFRQTAMIHAPSLKEKLRECIHYVSSCLLSQKKHFIQASPLKGMTLVALPFGYLLSFYVRYEQRKRNAMGSEQ